MSRSASTIAVLRRASVALAAFRREIVLLLAAILASAIVGLSSSFCIRAIFDDAIHNNSIERLLWYSFGIFAAALLVNFISLKQTVWGATIGQGVMLYFRNKLFTHLQGMPLEFFARSRAGDVHSRLTNDIGALQSVVSNFVTNVVGNSAVVVSIVSALFYVSPSLTLLSLLVLPAFVINSRWISKVRRQLAKDRQRMIADISSTIQESLSTGGALLIRTSGTKEQVCRQFAEQSQQLVRLELRQQVVGRVGFMGFGMLYSLVPALVYALAGTQLIMHAPVFGVSMTAGSLVAFVALQARLFTPASQLFTAQAELQVAATLFERIFEYLDMPLVITDRPNAHRFDRADFQGRIVFSQVWFAYGGGVPEAAGSPVEGGRGSNIRDVSFEILPGQSVALVGPSGGGKTTLGYMIPRLIEPTQGSVKIDGWDTRDVTIKSLASVIGFVPQETFLMHATVRENLRYAKSDATDAEIEAAAKAALIHDRILRLERGYDTIIGDRGHKLSGGERQRLAIARAVLTNPPILILDEATSALDALSEQSVQEALDNMRRGRTTITIAHRLSTVRNADLILVVDGGLVVERGTHAELFAQKGLYFQLYHKQHPGHANA